MNILFFLTPKSEVAYIHDDETLRQALEKMESRKYSAIPILNRKGKYVGTITEGDMLWGIKNQYNLNLKHAEHVNVSTIPRRLDYEPVYVNASMEDLISKALNQNFVPVVDDHNYFIGIIRRREILRYCYKSLMKDQLELRTEQETDNGEWKVVAIHRAGEAAETAGAGKVRAEVQA